MRHYESIPDPSPSRGLLVRRPLPAAALSLLLLFAAATAAVGQSATRQETVVIAMGREPVTPIPTLTGGSASIDVATLLFLPLAQLGPNNITAGDKDFVPVLARSWKRRDSLTLVFEMDPRARWHDGVPVTARDAALALNLARDSSVSAGTALLLRRVASATAEDPQHLVVRFTEAYDEQLYDAIYQVSPLPAHLVDTIPKGRLLHSAYASAPVGNGPYRWSRRVPGQQLDLVANDQFFLGKPGPRRVTILTVTDPEARMNLVLSGGADVLQTLGATSDVARVQADKRLAIYPAPSFGVGYLLFNQRDPADLTQPHPVLADRDVRTAIRMALDVPAIVEATFGDWASVPVGPVPQLFWIRDPAVRPPAQNTTGALALLKARGWFDTDGDGYLDRNGKPLALSINFPASSAPRAQVALLVQEQLRQVGIKIELNRLEGSVWNDRRNKGHFDIDFGQATLDPSPYGLMQSWGCAGRGGSNVGYYCDPKVDSLLSAALLSRKNALPLYRQAVRTIVDDVPAVFVYSPTLPFTVSRRIRRVEINPTYLYAALWRWNPGPLP
jgi:peptide/nickel transport system substrate-binding protein